jgi:hypothetical protein
MQRKSVRPAALLLAAGLAVPVGAAAQAGAGSGASAPGAAQVAAADGWSGAARQPARFAATDGTAQQTAPPRSGWTGLRIAKWSTLVSSVGLATYGFTTNSRADREYRRLEELCKADLPRCVLDEAGRYADPDLEQRYQEVLDGDRRARTTLIASQVGLASSVLLFIMDLRSDRPPPNIPYEPRGLTFAPRADGAVEVGLRLGVGTR